MFHAKYHLFYFLFNQTKNVAVQSKGKYRCKADARTDVRN